MPVDILGTGWKFPVRVDSRGGLALSSGEEDIREAIWLILATARGERQMEPAFGCGLQDRVFEPIGATVRGAIAHQAQEALAEWEPRIDVLEVRVDDDAETENLLLVRVDYRIRSTNAFDNLVYPLYLAPEAAA
jgi:uncharacterized protein